MNEEQRKAKEKQKALYRARNISTSYREPTVLGQPVRLLNGLYYPVLPNGTINASEGGYTSRGLDLKIGQGNATQGRIFKRSDGTWRFADGTVVTKFKSPTTTKKATPQTASQTTSSDVKTQEAGSSNTQDKTKLTTTRGTTSKQSPINTTQQSPTTQSNSYTQTPTSTGMTYSGQNWSFTVPRQQPNPSKDSYTSQPIVENTPNSINYDTNYIRGFRGQGQRGYRDVNSYLTWLGNNKDSDDYKLFMQNGYFDKDGNLDYGQIGTMLASQGIRGNLGRRDSRRLGNVLTQLRNQSTVGTPEHDQFMQGAVEQFNRNKLDYSPTQGKYAGRTFRDLQYDPTKGNEAISFVGNDIDDMEGWFEPSRQHLTLPYLQNFIGRNPYSIYNPFFDIFGNLKGGYNPTTGLENINKWWIPFINKSINTPGTGGYDVTTPPYFGFNRTLY